jgi:hydrogenase nickel incorporation protein HypB
MMSSPGSGKTTLLKALAPHLAGKVRWGVMEADIDSSVDAEAISRLGVPAVQLHTGGMCHLDADMTRQGLRGFGNEHFDLMVLENVGNLVCPAEFDTGAVRNMTLLSVPEGDDKPLKYPLMYQACDLLAVGKTDVLPCFDFDRDRLVRNARARNPAIEILFLSAKTGEGVAALADWLLRQVREWTGA